MFEPDLPVRNMRDGFDPMVADRCKVLDDIAVPDSWSRVQSKGPDLTPVQFTEEVVTMINLTPAPTKSQRKRPTWFVVAAILAVAAAVAIVLVVSRDGDSVATDEASPTVTVTVPPAAPAPASTRALFGTPGEEFAPGTYFVDTVEGSPTPQIFVTIGDGWSNGADGWAIGKRDIGFMTFSKPDKVFLDACQSSDGYHPGPVTTLDGLVTALREQGGWVDVTAPSDISVDGYSGKAFQRTAPAEFVDCSTSFAPFRSWENEDENGKGWSYYDPGETETLWVIDVDGTVVILNTRVLAGQPAAVHADIAAVLDSIRISPS